MLLDTLTFGTFKETAPNIMEIIIHEDETMDEEKIALIEKGVLEKYTQPYCLLVNRVHTYHHTPGSMERVAQMKNCIAIAIVVHNVTGETFAKMHQHFQDNIQIFREWEKAEEWLKERLKEEQL